MLPLSFIHLKLHFITMKSNDILQKLIRFFSDYNLLSEFSRTNFYFDEPQLRSFFSQIDEKSHYFEKNNCIITQPIYGSGASFFDREIGGSKCLGEAVERLCQQTFTPKKIMYSSYNNLKQKAIDPSIHTLSSDVRNERIGWVTGSNIISKEKILIPAQYAHYTFNEFHNEQPITSLISTGGALGQTPEEALLYGLYELIERDAFTTTYLIKAPVKKVLVSSIQNNQISRIHDTLAKYALEWHLFDITHDLSVPVYLSLLIDRSGVGPAVTSGASSRLNHFEAIINSVTEATMTRPWIRVSLTNKKSLLSIINNDRKKIRERIDRGLYWFLPSKIALLHFWLKREEEVFHPFRTLSLSPDAELRLLISMLKNIHKSLYYCDITHDEVRKYGMYVYKIINPYLHGLYLDEADTRAVVDPVRLQAVAHHFGIKNYQINPIPHPFL